MMEKFSFTSAFMHFRNKSAPGGYVWKYLLAYLSIALVLVIVQAILTMTVFGPTLKEIEASGGVGIAPSIWILFVAFYIVVLIGYMIFMATFESSVLRHYIRKESFTLRFGADELRLLAVYLFWLLCLFGIYFVSAIAVLLITMIIGLGYSLASGGNSIGAFPMSQFMVVIMVITIPVTLSWFAVRQSPAAAITIRDRKVRFSSAAKAAKGRWWSMFGAYLLMAVGAFIVFGIYFGIVTALVPNSMTDPAQSSPVNLGLFGTNPALAFGLLVVYFIYMAVFALIGFAYAGIPAKAALTDPNWQGDLRAADIFS